MTDVFTKAKRSAVMSQIRGRNNKATELAMIKLFKSNTITGWRRHHNIFGKPDFVFLKHKLAVFVDGCFWHCCPKHGTKPKQNRNFWKSKLLRNKSRDLEVNRTLKKLGWKVLRVWEHELSIKNRNRLIKRLNSYISE